MSWFNPLTYVKDKQIEKQMHEDFKGVFSGERGDRVLNAILSDLHFYGEAINDEDRILSNAAKRILYRFGVYKDGNDIKITRFMKGGIQ